jgi:hypothetical protein
MTQKAERLTRTLLDGLDGIKREAPAFSCIISDDGGRRCIGLGGVMGAMKRPPSWTRRMFLLRAPGLIRSQSPGHRPANGNPVRRSLPI